MNSKDMKMLSEQYSEMYQEKVEHVKTTEDGYVITVDVEHGDDDISEFLFIKAPNEEKPRLVQDENNVPAIIDFHRQHGYFPEDKMAPTYGI